MAKHHPDLIFCRKQAGVGESLVGGVHPLTLSPLRGGGGEARVPLAAGRRARPLGLAGGGAAAWLLPPSLFYFSCILTFCRVLWVLTPRWERRLCEEGPRVLSPGVRPDVRGLLGPLPAELHGAGAGLAAASSSSRAGEGDGREQKSTILGYFTPIALAVPVRPGE